MVQVAESGVLSKMGHSAAITARECLDHFVRTHERLSSGALLLQAVHRLPLIAVGPLEAGLNLARGLLVRPIYQ